MKVFSACIKIIRRRSAMLILYFVIFMGLFVAISAAMFNQPMPGAFTQTRTKAAIVDRDGGEIAQALGAYMPGICDMVELEDEKSALQDALFFHEVDYILIIPAGFSEAFGTQAPMALETAQDDSSTVVYTTMQVERFLNLLGAYMQALPESAVQDALADATQSTQVTLVAPGEVKPVSEKYAVYMRMMSYILMCISIISVSTLLKVFQRPELRARNACAPLSLRRVNTQLVLGCAMIAFAGWVALVGVGFIFTGRDIADMDTGILLLMLLNSFIFFIIALAMAYLVGLFVKESNVQNAVSNFIPLLFSFLGGIFVPMELLGEGMLKVARFTPTYWYMSTLNHITALGNTGVGDTQGIWQGMLLQLGFAVAFISAAMLAAQISSKNSAIRPGNRTEVEQ